MSLVQKPPDNLTPKQWVDAVHVGFQEKIVNFLLWAYGFLLVATIAILLLQGFHVQGFALDPALLKWLGGATIGEIGGLLIFTFRAAFK
jgi:hypothetical protein